MPKYFNKIIFSFKAEVESICAALKSLELAINDIKSCETFKQIVTLILEIGNFLNGKKDAGYDILAVVPKVKDFKDFATKKSLLYHIIRVIWASIFIFNSLSFKVLLEKNTQLVQNIYGER